MQRYRIKDIGYTVSGKKSQDDSVTLKGSKFQIGDFMDIAIKVSFCISFILKFYSSKIISRNHVLVVATIIAIATTDMVVIDEEIHTVHTRT